MTQNSETNKKPPDPRQGKQTDLAEGELQTMEESIRADERKGDLPGGTAQQSKPAGEGKGAA